MSRKNKQKILKRIIDVSRALLWKNKITAGLIYTSLLMNIILFVGLFTLVKKGQSILIGHYNVFFGIDTIINTENRNELLNLFLPAIGGLFFLILSVLISIFLIVQLDVVGGKVKKTKGELVSNRAVSFVASRLMLIGVWFLQLVLMVYMMAIFLIN